MLRTFKDSSGQDRWMSISSSAFEDREGETVSRPAIDFSIADAGGDMGDLRLYHLPGSKIGTCDFQLRVGDFLIESGALDETDLSKAVQKSLSEQPGRWGVSIGFRYQKEDLEDGIYKKIKIFERSVLDESVAAALFTNITLMQEDTVMGKKILQDLIDLVGDEEKGKELYEAAKGLGLDFGEGMEIALKSDGSEDTEEKTDSQDGEKQASDEQAGEDKGEAEQAQDKSAPRVVSDILSELKSLADGSEDKSLKSLVAELGTQLPETSELTSDPRDFMLEIDDVTIKALADAVAGEVAEMLPARDTGLRDDLKTVSDALNSLSQGMEQLLKSDADKVQDIQKSLPRVRLGVQRASERDETVIPPTKDDLAEKNTVSPNAILSQDLNTSIAKILEARNAQ